MIAVEREAIVGDDYLPNVYLRFRDGFPGVAKALDGLGEAVDAAGPLDERTARLVKLGLAIGAAAEGSVRSNVRKALAAGATPEEIATEMGTTPERVREILKISQEPASLHTPIGDEGDALLVDFIEDKDATSPVEEVDDIVQREELSRVLQLLTQRERRIVELRFGLAGGNPRTLEEVGQKFGVTRERIRQIEAKTLAKLKAYRDAQCLREFLD